MQNFAFLVVLLLLITGCAKESADYADPAGGYLPTTYVVYKDSVFTPNSISIVAGNNITFLNQTSQDIKLMTIDSVTIPLTVIPANKYYFFNKDTVGTFYYLNPDRPSASGHFELRP